MLLIFWMVASKRHIVSWNRRGDEHEHRTKELSKSIRIWREVAIVEDCRCPSCAARVDEDEFRNEVFMKEFESSGLCQGCQDTVFGYKVAW